MTLSNNHRLTIAALTLLIFLSPFLNNWAFADTLDAHQIMKQVDARDDGDKSVTDMQMILINKNGAKRTRRLRSFGIDVGEDQYSMMYFLSPADVKGTAFLTYDYEAEGHADDQWLYLPALKKVKRIAVDNKSGSFMGSDFSYADFTKKRLRDYSYSFHPKQSEIEIYGEKCWVIESVPRNQETIEETGYIKSILFVRQDNLVVIRSINYLKNNRETKYYDIKKLELIEGIWTAREIHMTRKKGKATIHRTVLTLDNVKYNQESVNETLFTTHHLEKGL